MKKYYLLLLFVASYMNAQIGIINPTPYSVCETIPNSNEALFYLPFKNYEIFGALDPNNYAVDYFSDANMLLPISTPFQSSNTTIYIKVTDNSNPTIFQTTSLSLVVKTKPQVSVTFTQASCNSGSSAFFSGLPSGDWFLKINDSNSLQSYNTPTHLISNIIPGDYTYQIISSDYCYSDYFSVTFTTPTDVPVISASKALHHYENPFDGIMTFNLTLQANKIIGDQTGIDLIYYTSSEDAQNNTNPIVNPTAYQNVTNSQTIWVRAVSNTTTCYQITDFKIKAFDSATIVNIPDENFKDRLVSAKYENQIAFVQIGGNGNYGPVDFNGDGEIQYNEALNVIALNVNSGNSDLKKITSLTGIESFTNISNLNCSANELTELNITPLINNYLWSLDCSHNNLSTFDFNSLGSNLSVLNCSGNNITALNISNLVNLHELSCYNNLLTTLDIAALHLEKLDCSSNQISTLNFGYPEEITSLAVSNNLLTSLDLTSFSENLFALRCDGNTISNLDFSNVNPWQVSCGPVLNPIQIQNCTNLQSLSLRDTEQGTINFTNLVNLGQVVFWNTNIEEIDLSHSTNLYNFAVYNAQDLTYINIKTGQTWEGQVGNYYSYPITIGTCPNLSFICADETNIPKLNTVLNYHSVENVQINSYCSFIPGGNYNTISGAMIFDSNNNGCDAYDVPQPNIKVTINDETIQGATFTSTSGDYSFFTQAGSYSLTPNFENPSYFNVSPNPATVNFIEIDNSTITQNFCITPNGIHPDLEVVLVPIIPARPGFNAVYKIVYKNKGNQTVNGIVFFGFNYAYMDFVSSVPTQNNGTAGYYGFNFTDLAPFETRSILVTLNINAPTETNAVNIGDVLEFDANVILTSGATSETETDDNLFTLNQTVVGSFDPNDITCLQGNALPLNAIGKYMHYNIRFENTGTAPAENIVVKNTIDLTQYNIQSLQVMESSHPVTVKVIGNIAEFIFQGINLDTGGHGNILLKLKSNTTLADDLVINSADIFFDYNFPIVTNDEQTVFADLSKNDFNKDISIKVYPNPAENEVHIKAENTINSIQLFDVQGRLLQTKLSNQNTESVDLSNYSSGIYFVTVSTTAGKQTSKISKK